MNRYFYSFILALFIYSSIFASTLYFTKSEKLAKTSREISKEINKVKISFVEPIKTETKAIKKVVKKEQKPQKKKIVKKIPEKTPKKKIVKKFEKPKKIEKKIVKKVEKKPEKKIVKKIEKPIKKKEILVKKELKPQNQSPKKVTSKALKKDKENESEKIKELQNKYFAQISQTINKNKSYPKRAVLRNLQDDIKIEFMISPKGELLSFNIIKGKKIFYKSAKKAIEKSFPMTPPSGILSSNKKIKLTLAYRLN